MQFIDAPKNCDINTKIIPLPWSQIFVAVSCTFSVHGNEDAGGCGEARGKGDGDLTPFPACSNGVRSLASGQGDPTVDVVITVGFEKARASEKKLESKFVVALAALL
jgi:hypothetical protein